MMQSEKHLNLAVLLYLFSLMILAIANMIDNFSIIDVVYLIVLICGVFRIIFAIREERK